jgi:hypothetical protein
MAETFTNTVYEQADSLKPVADKLGLKIETAVNVSVRLALQRARRRTTTPSS